jgi:hypothetical protein
MLDLLIIEKGSGGDAVLQGNDLAVTTGYENMPYLAMFGGRDDDNYWANDLLFNDGDDIKFSASTERVMESVALNSAGRIAIENAILADLAFIKKIPGTEMTVTTSIVNADRMDIEIKINGKTFFMQWHPNTAFLTYRI